MNSAKEALSTGLTSLTDKLVGMSPATQTALNGFNAMGLGGVSSCTAIVGAMAGVGVAVGVGVDSANQLDGAMRNLQATTGASGSELQGYEDILRSIYTNNWGQSFDDIGVAMGSVKTQLQGIDDVSLQNVTEGALMLRDNFGMDLNESIRGIDQLMTQFGLTADEALDYMVSGVQNGLNYTDELSDNISEYAGKFAQAGYSTEEYFQLLENGSQGGAYNLDKVNDAINEVTTRLGDGTIADNLGQFSTKTQEVFTAWQNGGASQKEVIDSIVADIQNCSSEQEKMALASIAFGTMGEDANMQFVESLTSVGNSFSDVTGKCNEAKETVSGGLGTALSGLGRAFQDMLIPLGELVLPLITMIVEAITGLINFITPAIQGIVDFIITGVQGLILFFSDFGTNLTALIQGVINGIVSFISTCGSTIWSIVNGIISGVVGFITACGTTIWNVVTGIVNTVVSIIQGIVGVIIGIVDGIVSGITATINVITSVFSAVFNACQSIVQGVFNAIVSVIQTAISVISGIINGIISIFSTVWNTASSIVSSVFSGIVSLIQGAINTVSNIVSGISNVFSSVFNAISGIVSNVMNTVSSTVIGVFNGIQNAWNGLTSFVSGVFSGIGNAVNQLVSQVKGFVNGVISGINGAIGLINMIPGVNIGTIPMLAKGGVLAKGQVGLLEGNGAEAVVPLERNKHWIRAVAKDMARIMPNVSTTSNDNRQTVNFYQPIQTADEVARTLRLQKMYGLAGEA